MARKSRKNLPVVMGEPVDNLMAQTAGSRGMRGRQKRRGIGITSTLKQS